MATVRQVLRVIYWLIAIFIIFPIFGKIVSKLYRTFRDSSMSFTLDTLYLNWNTTFPAITVCEIYNGEKNWDVSEMYFGLDRDHRIDDFVSDITFFSGRCEACFYCDDLDCPKEFDDLLRTFRTSCDMLIVNCSWLGKSFECCEEFLILQTDYGNCYSFNSMQTEKFTELKFINNRQTGPGNLNFAVSEDVQIHVHPPNDIPYMLSEGVIRETVLWGSSKEIIFNIVEIVNDPSVSTFEPEHRRCRFYYEVEKADRLYRYYSFSTCIMECLKDAHLLLCGCTSHFMPRIENETDFRICDIEGLKCLSENNDRLIHHRRNNCPCLSSCEEPEYNVIYVSGESDEDERNNTVTISMIELPSQRYVRNVVKTNLDLIISVGGIGGLFFGASLLSFIEIMYVAYIALGKFIAKKRVAPATTNILKLTPVKKHKRLGIMRYFLRPFQKRS